MSNLQTAFWLLAAILLNASAASAAPLVYTPVNPSFGGNPANESVLMGEAAINKPAQKIPSTSASSASAIATQLQNNIIASVSSSVAGQIVGTGAIPGGSKAWATAPVSAGNRIRLRVVTSMATVIGTDGSSTQFTVPIL